MPDNSVSMRWCLEDGTHADLAYADRTLEALQDDFALEPALRPLETANALTREEAKKLITIETSMAFLARLAALHIGIDRTTADHALGDTLNLARSDRLSAYDAAYLELAVRQQSPIATLDKSLRKAARLAGVSLF